MQPAMDSEDDDRTVIRPKSVPTTGQPPTMAQTRPMTSIPPSGGAPAAPQHHAITLPAGTRLGEFELTSTIGEGGFGIVYLAWDHSLERKVALKEYMPSSIAYRDGTSEIRARGERHQETFDAGMKSFINEAKLLAQFDHPSLLKVYRFWEANGTAYMVMPFLEGATLRDTVRALATPPDEAWIVSLLNPICDALAMLHGAQVYHRDIAPDNILLLAETGRPLLLDFGAARRVIGDMTQALTAILKPGYAPVEQYAEMPGMKQGPWTDVYALAAVVHWMILGKTPAPSVGRLFDDGHVPLLQSAKGRYSDVFLSAVDRGLAVKPDQRTQSVDAFRADLLGRAPPPAVAATASVGVPLAAPPQGPLFDDAGRTQLDPRTRANARTVAQARPAPSAAVAAPKRSALLPLSVGAGVLVVAAIAAAMFWPKSAPAPKAEAPRVVTPEPPPQSAAAAIPATPSPSSASTVVAAPTLESPASTPALTVPSPEPGPTVTRTADPVRTEPKTVAKKAPQPRSEARERNTEARSSEGRTAEPKAAESDAGANRSECARLFQRLSIGDTDQALIDRIRTLRCR